MQNYLKASIGIVPGGGGGVHEQKNKTDFERGKVQGKKKENGEKIVTNMTEPHIVLHVINTLSLSRQRV